MRSRDVLSNFAIVGDRRIAQCVRQLQTFTRFGYRSGRSLQTFIFPILFFEQDPFLGSLHYLANKLPRTARIGGRRAVRKPPFCRMRCFCRNEVFFSDNALRSFFLRRSSFFWRSLSGTLPFITFLAHSLTQSINCLSHLRTYSRFTLSPSFDRRFNTGKYFFTRRLISTRRRNASDRKICSRVNVNRRPVPVEGRRANNCTVRLSHLYKLRWRIETFSDTSDKQNSQTGWHLADF